MSYNSPEQAELIIGQTVAQAHLDAAYSIINRWTTWRWASTSMTEILSGDGVTQWIQLRSPVISISTFTIDDTSQTEDSDYEVRKPIGRVYVYGGLPWGHDNITITYTYGYVDGGDETEFYNDTVGTVKLAEAQLALYLKKNPLMLDSVNIEGSTINFGDLAIQKFLSLVPRPISFGVGGPSGETEVWGETLL